MISAHVVRVRLDRAGLHATDHQRGQGAGRADPALVVAVQGEGESGRSRVGVGRIKRCGLNGEIVKQDPLDSPDQVQLPADLPVRLPEHLIARAADNGGEEPIHGGEGRFRGERRRGRTQRSKGLRIGVDGDAYIMRLHRVAIAGCGRVEPQGDVAARGGALDEALAAEPRQSFPDRVVDRRSRAASSWTITGAAPGSIPE